MPDIDIDFQDDRRDEILEYVANKYGRDHVAQIITFGTMAARAAVKDVGRVHGIEFQKMNNLTKLIPSRPGTMLQDALDTEEDLKKVYDTDPEVRTAIDTALKLEGTIRHAGVHACAVVIAENPLVNYTALQNAPGKAEGVITQYSMKPLEYLGLLKMDFLGLRNLTIINKTLGIIKRRHEKDLDIGNIPLDDRKTYSLLSKGETTGVFQLESSGMKRYLKDLKPTQLEDIIAMVSLYRPGPMDFIPDYISGKHGRKRVEYVHEDLEPILKTTYGIAVYQEQILQIAQTFAGFSLGDADLLRRAIGKKIAKELKAQRAKFIDGGVKKGYTKRLATDIFDEVIEPFANYGFNKSHAACYAMIAYQTAYLKAHYPAEFMAALLTAEQENSDRVAINIEECSRMGINILPPDVNESLKGFTVIDDKTIRFGFAAIKNLGDDTIEHIIKTRDAGIFESIGGFASRLPQKCLNKKSLEALAKAGALDSLAERNAVIESVDLISDYAKGIDAGKAAGQADIFSMMDNVEESHTLKLRKVEPVRDSQKLAWEKEILGLYVSSHPLKGMRKYLKSRVKLAESLSLKDVSKTIKVAGIVSNLKKIRTKRGDTMVTFMLEDPSGVIPITIFPGKYKEYQDEDIFEEDNFVVLGGKVDYRNNELQFICSAAKKVSLDVMKKNAKESGMYDENDNVQIVRSIPGIPEEAPADEDIVDITSEILKFGEEHGLLAGDTSEEKAKSKTKAKDIETLRLKKGISKSDLTTLKTLLEKHQGKQQVQLEVYVKDKWKKVPIPFGVEVNSKLKSSVKEYLAG
jgi:DNA polymerase-3 subunit alpha